jgi:DNA-binding NarL/FixJ family response regulator
MGDSVRKDSPRKDSKSTSRKTGSGRQQPAGNERSRIIIADDDPLILDQIASLLETRFEVVARVENGSELVDAVNRLAPAVVVADIAMPKVNGIDAARQITKTNRDVKVVMLSGYSDDALVEAAFEAGASGYVVKLSAFSELIPAIEKVLAGQSYWPHDVP